MSKLMYKDKAVGGALSNGLPVGTIIPFASNATLPNGFLRCEGQAVSRTMYPALFSVIGTEYGMGDGSTTFNLPNLMNAAFLNGSYDKVVYDVAGSYTFTAQKSGFYKITIKGAGGGGASGSYASSGNSYSGSGGGEGGTTIGYEHLIAGDTVSVVVGAGGTGGAKRTSSGTENSGADGGNSSVIVNNNTYTGGGGGGGTNYAGSGGTGTIPGAPGESRVSSANTISQGGASGGGAGGGHGSTSSSDTDPAFINGTKGGGGAGGYGYSSGSYGYAGGNGGDGYCWIEYIGTSQSYIIKTFESVTRDSAMVDITQYASDLANKSDRDLSNLSAKGISVISSMGKGYTQAIDDDHIYGFKIDKNDSNPATRVTYTDDAEGFTPVQLQSDGTMKLNDWEGTFILDAFRPVMLNYSGTVAYELDHSDQTKKLDGTASDITDTAFNGNAMVGVKTLYLSCFEDADSEYCRVATYHVDDTFHAYAHIDRNGVIKPEVYLPMFEGSNVSSRLRSLAGRAPLVSSTAAQEINYAVANGSGWYIDDFSNHKLIENLGILVSRSTNSQVSFGRGYVDGNSAPITTGTLKDKGMFYGPSGGKSAVKLFYIENYYGSRNDRCAGVMTRSDYAIWIKPHPPYNTNGEGYFCFPTTITSNSYGYMTKMQMTDFGLIPKTVGGSETTYYTDFCWLYSGTNYGVCGCYYSLGGYAGLSSIDLDYSPSFSHVSVGASLSYK